MKTLPIVLSVSLAIGTCLFQAEATYAKPGHRPKPEKIEQPKKDPGPHKGPGGPQQPAPKPDPEPQKGPGGSPPKSDPGPQKGPGGPPPKPDPGPHKGPGGSPPKPDPGPQKGPGGPPPKPDPGPHKGPGGPPPKPAPKPHPGPPPHWSREQQRIREDAHYIIERTTMVLREAQQAARYHHYSYGLAKAVSHQQKARDLYWGGHYRDAIYHSLRARDLAYQIIRGNRWSYRPEYDWNELEHGYRRDCPRDQDLDLRIEWRYSSDKELILIRLIFDLD